MSILKKIIVFIVIFILTATFIFAAVQIVNYINYGKENEEISNEIAEKIICEEDKDEGEKNIDFASLKAMNSDTVGYLKVNGTSIASAVVQSKDNDYYLYHNFKKNYNKGGWIFADYRNRFDGTDKNIVIYGHNMKNGSMFSSLKNILTKDWQETEENMYVTFITEHEVLTYKVFSVYQIEVEDYYTTTAFNNKTFQSFIDKIKSRSEKDFNADVKVENQILTLSTCADNDKYRIVLHAVKL